MITRTKKIVYGAALAAATGLLVPVVLDVLQKEEPREARVELPADGPVPQVPTEQAEPVAEEPAPAASRPVPVVRGGPTVLAPAPEPGSEPGGAPVLSEDEGEDELVSALESSLGQLENFGTAAQQPDLDALAATWGTRAGESSAPDFLSDPLAAGTLVEFLSHHPLRGIIHGGERSAALMGGRVVHEGDALLPGVASVERIDPRSVTLLYRGSEVPVDLPPLRPRSATGSSGEDSGSTTIGAGGGELDSEGPKEERDA